MWNKWNIADAFFLCEFTSGKPTLVQYYSNFAFDVTSILIKNWYYVGNIYNQMSAFEN